MSSNSPYESTIILQNEALNKMLANIKAYPVAGKKTGIRLRPNKDGTRLQIQNVRSVKIVPDGNKTYLIIEDPTDDDVLNKQYIITGELSFSPETNLTQNDNLTPGMFNIKENNILKQSVLIKGLIDHRIQYQAMVVKQKTVIMEFQQLKKFVVLYLMIMLNIVNR